MRDITNDFINAIDKTEFWQQDFSFAIERIHNNGYIISFWEEENWAVISSGSDVIGYIWKKHPLLIVLNLYTDQLRSILRKYKSLVYISTDSLTEQSFLVDYRKLKDYIDYGLADDGFSAEDLWFLTNT